MFFGVGGDIREKTSMLRDIVALPTIAYFSMEIALDRYGHQLFKGPAMG
jgi:hypothetical protein